MSGRIVVLLVGVLVLVLVGSRAVYLPEPRIKYSHPNRLEISFQGVPGVKYLHIQYGTNGRNMQGGPFHLAVDGRWYHHNDHAHFEDKTPVPYQLIANKDGVTITVPGTFQTGHYIGRQGDTNIILSPPQRMRRVGKVVFHDDFNLPDGSKPNKADWSYEISMYGGMVSMCNGNCQDYIVYN